MPVSTGLGAGLIHPCAGAPMSLPVDSLAAALAACLHALEHAYIPLPAALYSSAATMRSPSRSRLLSDEAGLVPGAPGVAAGAG
jgi:hypothetical protein